MNCSYLSTILLTGFLSFSISSCASEDQPASIEGLKAQTRFAIVIPEGVESKAITVENPLGDTPCKSYTQCMSQFHADKTYTINSIAITNDTNLSQVYFSGVTSEASFASYVSQTFTV